MRAMEATKTLAQDRPEKEVVIAECGELKEGEGDGVEAPADGDVYEDWPQDAEDGVEGGKAAADLKDIGNKHFKVFFFYYYYYSTFSFAFIQKQISHSKNRRRTTPRLSKSTTRLLATSRATSLLRSPLIWLSLSSSMLLLA